MKTKQIELPSLNDDAEYTAANAKLTALRVDLLEAEKKRDAVLSDINTPRPYRDPIQDAAQKMLNGDTSPLPSAATKELWETFQDLLTRITVIRTAIRMQEGIVSKLLAAASFNAVALVQPHHRGLVRSVVEQIKTLDATLTAEHDLREQLFLGGFNTGGLRHMGINSLGLLSNEHSRASSYLLEAFREGFISQSELPENLQKMLPTLPAAKKPLMQAIKAKFDDWTPA